MAMSPIQDTSARERARRRRQEQVRRRRMVLATFLLALVVLVVALFAGLSGGDDTATTAPTGGQNTTTTLLEAEQFTATLTGANSVPPVATASTGELVMDYDPVALTLTYVLSLDGLRNPTSAAIYEGAPGTSGTTVYVLWAGPTQTTTGPEGFQGELAAGAIEPGKLTGGLQDGTIGDLVALIKAGNAYVSVGNTSYPVDAIRGPIR